MRKNRRLGFFGNVRKYYRYAVRSAKAELKSEVADSYLNWLWWIIEPVCFTAIYAFVFTVIFQNKEQYFVSFVMIGQAIWQFFERMISGSVKLIANNRDLVTKVYIPKYILLLSKSFTYLFKLAIALGICFATMAIEGVPFDLKFIWAIPVIIVLYIVTFGIGLILMNLGVVFSDLANLTNIWLKMMFYLSGIFYNIRLRLGEYVFLTDVLLFGNVAAFVMDAVRECMLYGRTPNLGALIGWLLIGVVLMMIGIWRIRKNENTYAKVV